MILLNGKPLLEYVMNELPDEISELVIVVGYHGDKVRAYFGTSYKGRPITYVEQKEYLGTGHAVLMAKEHLPEKFMLVNSDDIGDKESFTKGLVHEYVLFVAEDAHPERFGVVEMTPEGTLQNIIEKPEHPTTNVVSTGSMILQPAIFSMPMIRHQNGEHYVVDMLRGVMKEHPIQVMKQKSWITITYPEDVEPTEKLLKKIGK